MPISHKIRQYRALLGFAHQGEVPGSAERPGKSRPSRECGAVLCTKFWLALFVGAGVGVLEQSGDPSLVVPRVDVSRLFRVVVRLPFCPAPPILITESCWRKQTASVLLTRRWPMRGLCWLHGLGLGPWPRHTAWFLAGLKQVLFGSWSFALLTRLREL